jgi:hypothetical protein
MPIKKVGRDTPSSDTVMNNWLSPSAPAQRGIHPHGNANHQRHGGGHQGQLHGGRKALGDQARDLGALAQAQAKLALHRVDQKVAKLHHKRLVQPQVDRRKSICSWVASCPSKNTTGSPTYWNSKNAMNATVTMTITAWINRCRDKSEHQLTLISVQSMRLSGRCTTSTFFFIAQGITWLCSGM